MNIKTRLFRGLTMVFAFLLVLSITTALIMEDYRQPLDENTGSVSSQVVVDSEDGEWTYSTQYNSTKEAVEDMKEFAIREAAESFVLLKNQSVDNQPALPLTQDKPKVTLFGIRSYTPYYGSTTGGSIPDRSAVENGNTIQAAFQAAFDVNPTMLSAYEDYCADLTWGSSGFGATAPIYKETYSSTNPCEPTFEELGVDADDAGFREYNDAAIVIIGRVSGEGISFYPGTEGMDEGVTTNTDNILGISAEEQALIDTAKANFDKVIVLINSSSQMEIESLKQDEGVDAVLWIGYPGVYGFEAVADVLLDDENPSGRLGDIYAVNSALSPAMQNYGVETAWTNASNYGADDNVNSYLVEAEGIYTGYRYYETRYADSLRAGDDRNALVAKAGTYVNYDAENLTFKPATTDGQWIYSQEVSYPFGYGLSYTTFTQELESVTVSADHKTAVATVKVTNSGTTAGKSVVQLYVQLPYAEGDVEKSAIQLVDFEKTDLLEGGASETITLNIDMSNLTSYDYEGAKTFIMDAGTYYFAIGESSHDALNNILAKQGVEGTVDTATGETVAIGADVYDSKVKTWELTEDDTTTFSTSDNGTTITNQVTEGYSAMDANYWLDNGISSSYDEIVYLSRSDWNGTFPITYTGFSITSGSRLDQIMKNDFIALEDMTTSTPEDEIVAGDTYVSLNFNDMKGVAFEDEKWDELVSKIPVSEILDFMANAFHNIQGIPSI